MPKQRVGHTYGLSSAKGNARAHFGDVNNTVHNTVACGINHIPRDKKDIQNVKTSELPEWIPAQSLDFGTIHQRIREEADLEVRQYKEFGAPTQTGQWLLESDFFQGWLRRDIQYLWLYGMPGAGKSTLASIIIEKGLNIQQPDLGNKPKGKFAYLYLSHVEADSVDKLLISIVNQVARGDSHMQSVIEKFNVSRGHRKTMVPTVPELTTLIDNLTKNAPIYVVADAADEVDQTIREPFIKALKPRKRHLTGVSLLVTSRIQQDFETLSMGFRRESIVAHNADLGLYIDHIIEEHGDLERVAPPGSNVRKELHSILKVKCDGMFLLASLHLRGLIPCFRSRTLEASQLLENLRHLPTLPQNPSGNVLDGESRAQGLADIYYTLWNRIYENRDKDTDGRCAFLILAWVVLSPQKLSLTELRGALSCHRAPIVLDADDRCAQQAIRDICNGLVNFSQGFVSLVHHTAHHYFEVNASTLFRGYHAEIARSCAWYLCQPGLETPLCDQQLMLSQYGQIDSFPLARYAARWLPYHLRQSDDEISTETCQTIVTLLTEGPKLAFFQRLVNGMGIYQPPVTSPFSLDYRLWDITPWNTAHQHRTGGSVSPKDFAYSSMFDVDYRHYAISSSASPSMIGYEVNNWTEEGSTGRDDESVPSIDMCDQLIAYVMDLLDIREKNAIQGYGSSTSEEDESKSEDDDADQTDDKSGRELMALTRDTYTSTAPQATSLHMAAAIGNQQVLHEILKTHAKRQDVDALDEFGRSPIVVAVSNNNMKAVQLCLDYGAKVDLSMVEGLQILMYVIQEGKPEEKAGFYSIVRQNRDLLDVESDVHWFSAEYVLAIPVLLGCAVVATVVLLSSYTVSSRNRLNRCGLDIGMMALFSCVSSDNILSAVERGDAAGLSRVLAAHRTKGNEKSQSLEMVAAFLAVELHHLVYLKMLVDHGLDLTITDFNGNTLLHQAATQLDMGMMEFLLSNGTDVTAKNSRRDTAWTTILKPGNEEALNLLASHGGADPDATDRSNNPILYGHAAGGNLEMVQFMLDNGINASKKTIYGWAPLHWAAHNNRFTCVKALLAGGAEHSPPSPTGETPLSQARSQGHWEVVRLLEESGATECIRKLTSISPYENEDLGNECGSPKQTGNEAYEDSEGSTWHLLEESLPRDQKNFKAALTRIEELTSLSGLAKRKLMEFFLRPFAEVMFELDQLEETDLPENLVEDWTLYVEDMRSKKGVQSILKYEWGQELGMGEAEDS